MLLTLPTAFAIDEATHKNPIRQIGERVDSLEGTLATFTRDRLRGFMFRPIGGGNEILIVPPKSKHLPEANSHILQSTVADTAGNLDLSEGLWLRHPVMFQAGRVDREQEIRSVLASWTDAFAYAREDLARGVIGLRNPQIGAVHRIHAHWSVSEDPATIVMPTGTGKTETMLSVLISAGCAKLLVIVPTDALRAQLAWKFISRCVCCSTFTCAS